MSGGIRIRFIPLLAAALALFLALPAGADDLCTTSEPELDTSEATDTRAASRHYVDIDFVQPGCCFTFWIYEESNGVEGLQRQDDIVDDTDGGRCYPADTVIF